MPYDTKRGLWILTDTVEFLPSRSTMQIEVVVPVPHIVDRNTVWGTFEIDQ